MRSTGPSDILINGEIGAFGKVVPVVIVVDTGSTESVASLAVARRLGILGRLRRTASALLLRPGARITEFSAPVSFVRLTNPAAPRKVLCSVSPSVLKFADILGPEDLVLGMDLVRRFRLVIRAEPDQVTVSCRTPRELLGTLAVVQALEL